MYILKFLQTASQFILRFSLLFADRTKIHGAFTLILILETEPPHIH